MLCIHCARFFIFLQCSIERLQGSFGTVQLRVLSYLLNSSTGERTSATTGTDLNPTTVQLTFSEDETSMTFDIEIINEETPEFEEIFELVLTIENADGDGARVGSSSTSLIVVSENDDPHGLFVISTASRVVDIAEDVGEGDEGGSVDVRVERSFGNSGTVQVRICENLSQNGKGLTLETPL